MRKTVRTHLHKPDGDHGGVLGETDGIEEGHPLAGRRVLQVDVAEDVHDPHDAVVEQLQHGPPRAVVVGAEGRVLAERRNRRVAGGVAGEGTLPLGGLRAVFWIMGND